MLPAKHTRLLCMASRGSMPPWVVAAARQPPPAATHCRGRNRRSEYLEGPGDLVSRVIMGISEVTIWVIGDIRRGIQPASGRSDPF